MTTKTKPKARPRTKHLAPTLLGVMPFDHNKLRGTGPGVFVRVQTNTLVRTPTRMNQVREVVSIPLSFTNGEICLNPELRLALAVVSGVESAITVLANYAISKQFGKKQGTKRPSKA
jgi:hypothetical protein